ncbi:DUF742 domain-containing protein [Microbispora sp. H10830]|nr:DUF742 domain-containing protein [Microbispora sp. H10830]
MDPWGQPPGAEPWDQEPGTPWGRQPGAPIPEEPASPVRPFTVTGGRTTPRMQLALEALVSSATTTHYDLSTRPPEFRAIASLCRQVRSVAEVSALLRIPLGVVRVVIADMAAEGLVHVHQPQLEAGKPDLNLLERVLSGLRRL